MKTLYLANLPEENSVFALMSLQKEELITLREGLEEVISNLTMSHFSCCSCCGFPFMMNNSFISNPEMQQHGTELYAQLLHSKDMLECINKEIGFRYIQKLGGPEIFKEAEDVMLTIINEGFYEDAVLQSLDKMPLPIAIKSAVGSIRE